VSFFLKDELAEVNESYSSSLIMVMINELRLTNKVEIWMHIASLGEKVNAVLSYMLAVAS